MKITYKRVCALLLISILTLTGCGDSSADSESSPSPSASAEDEVTSETSTVSYSIIDPGYSDRDLDGTWDSESAVNISLNGSSIEADNSGVSIDGSTLTITSSGVFVISGTLSSGQISVEATDTDKVQIVLNGASITSSDGPAILALTADKVFVTLAEGTENYLTDSAEYTLAEGEDEPNACLYSKQDLTINGSGTLTVVGNYRHGILSKDDLVISGGIINVTAVEDGIRGRDSVGICGGTITVTAGGDGIKSNNDTDTSKGWISLDDGAITITSDEDGIQAETVLQLLGSEVTIIAGGGSGDVAATSNQEGFFGWGNSEGQEDTDSTSTKGLKASGAVFVTGGTATVDSLDDSVHSDGTVAISGGTLNLSTGDDGIHADTQLLVEAGTITVSQSYEGLEGVPVIIKGGQIDITASDDGINSGGDDDSAANGEVAGPFSNNASDDTYIEISGGLVVVDAGGDGLDSNKNIYISGGTVLVTGPTDGANGALDYEGTAEITGGTLIAVGSTGMAMNLSDTSTQPSLMVNYSSSQQTDTLLTLCDSEGNVIVSFKPQKAYQSVVISSPDMVTDGEYTLYTGGEVSGESTYNLYEGSFSGGTEVITVTMSSVIVSTTDTGEAVSSMGMGEMPGGGGGGGAMGRGNMPDDGTMPSDGEMPGDGNIPGDGEMPGDGNMPSDMPSGGARSGDGNSPAMGEGNSQQGPNQSTSDSGSN